MLWIWFPHHLTCLTLLEVKTRRGGATPRASSLCHMLSGEYLINLRPVLKTRQILLLLLLQSSAETLPIPKESWFRFLCHFGGIGNQNWNQMNRKRNRKGNSFRFQIRFISRTAEGIAVHDSSKSGSVPAPLQSSSFVPLQSRPTHYFDTFTHSSFTNRQKIILAL